MTTPDLSIDVPRETKAAVCHAAATYAENRKATWEAFPALASHHDLTIEQVKAIVYKHGWPKPKSLRTAAAILARNAETAHTITQPAPAAAADAAAGQGDSYELLEVDALTPDPANVRLDLGDLTELAGSIKDVGILQPIVARRHDGHLVIVMGHRRHAAARLAGLHQVPVIVRDDMDRDDVLAAMIVENGQRLGLDPIEEARALARLKATDNATDKALGDRISKSQAYVSGRLALLELTPSQQAAVRSGTMPLARAIKTGRDRGGLTRPESQGKKSAAHLDWHHPLAETAALRCSTQGHSKHMPGRPGGVACGHCWEHTIRADERRKITRGANA